MIDGELGGFLRARREAVRPEDVGLPAGGRRRTPGLRRSEVATLAGISVEYLTRLEQGRDRHPSTQVIAAIADALRLDADDRFHLHQLVALSQGTELVCAGGCPDEQVPSGLTRLLEQLEPAPAVVVGPRTELLAWTETFDRLVRPLGMLEGDPPVLVDFAFTAAARDRVPDWPALADALVAWLHVSAAGPSSADLVAELSASAGAEFTTRWDRRPTGPPDLGLRALAHPEVGLVRLDQQVLLAGDGLSLVTAFPSDAAAEAALDRLAGRRPGTLRAAR